MSTRITKAELQERLEALTTENAALKAQLAQLKHPTEPLSIDGQHPRLWARNLAYRLRAAFTGKLAGFEDAYIRVPDPAVDAFQLCLGTGTERRCLQTCTAAQLKTLIAQCFERVQAKEAA